MCPTSTNSPIVKVDWNRFDRKLIASGSFDGMAFVYRLDDKNQIVIDRQYKYGGQVVGVSWSLFER